MVHQLIWNYGKLNYLRWYSQENLLINGVGETMLRAVVEGLKRGMKVLSKDTVKRVAKNAPLIAKNIAVHDSNKKLNEFRNDIN